MFDLGCYKSMRKTREEKCKKYVFFPQNIRICILEANSVNVVFEQVRSGVRTTYLSCSCDISVGRTGLSSWFWKSDPSSLRWNSPGWGPRQQTRCPLLRERVLSAFLAFLGAMLRNRGRFYLWQGRGLDYRWQRGRGLFVNYPEPGCDWLSWWPIPGAEERPEGSAKEQDKIQKALIFRLCWYWRR